MAVVNDNSQLDIIVMGKSESTRTSRVFLSIALALLGLSAVVLPVIAQAAAPAVSARANSEAEKIEALIAAVEKAKGLRFIRNGSEHDPAAAADHLRLKWKNAGKRVRTAEDFIRYCATGSSISGKPYQIRFADGRLEDSAAFFHAQLRAIEAGASKPKPVAGKP